MKLQKKNDTGFVMIPNALLTHYNFFPKFNGNTLMVYAYLKKLENSEWGYAFPSQNQAMADLGISDTTFKTQVGILVDCELITVKKHKSGSFTNNIYYVHDPIDNASIFYDKFPKAKLVHNDKQTTAAKIGRRRRKASEDYLGKLAEQSEQKVDDSAWI